LELWVLDWLQSMRCSFLDTVMVWITDLGNGGVLWIVCTMVLLIFPRTRRVGAALAIALLLSSLCTNVVLKPLVGRTRPCDVNTAVTLLVHRPGDYSFPSGHTSAAFAAAAALYFGKNRLWIPAVILASLIAFSRLYLYVHYPSDVLVGILIGIASGWIGNYLLCHLGTSAKNP
jgi:undecaprenyl-diphosphatase